MGAEQASVTVVGAGAWGGALAQHLAVHGRRVVLWDGDAAALDAIRKTRVSPRLPEVRLSPDILVHAELGDALADGEWVVLAVPCAAMREVAGAVAAHLDGRPNGVVWTCKGFEPPDGVLMHEVLGDALGPKRPTACLSGPTFAAEVAVGRPTAATLASHDRDFARRTAAIFHAGDMRVYPGEDVVGVEVAGALKNVIAIAAGICDGLKLGANARAALIARGLAEIGRLSKALGGQERTLTGLAGVGDIVLTCTDDQSRNRRFGAHLAGVGGEVAETVEGASTARAACVLAARHDVSLPICAAVADVIEGRVEAVHAVKRLLEREMKREE